MLYKHVRNDGEVYSLFLDTIESLGVGASDLYFENIKLEIVFCNGTVFS